jgi:HSP20 family protein
MRSLITRPRRFDLAGEIDQMFNTFFPSPVWQDNHCAFVPAVDIHETADEFTLTLELPGVEKKDIKVGVEENVLTISGERKFQREDKDGAYIRSEIQSGSFSRSFSLPKTVDSGKISADFKDGLLTVKLGKAEKAKPKEIEIKVS